MVGEIKVSLVIPVFNVEEYIGATFSSILKQDFNHNEIELVIIDDGSQDNSIEIINQILLRSDIRYKIIRQKNAGQSSARNRGIKNAIGKYICFVDSDDILYPSYISDLYININKYNVNVGFCNFSFSKEDLGREKKFYVLSNEEILNRFLLRKYPIIVPGIMISKKILNKLKFVETTRFSEDQIFLWMLFNECENIVYVDKVLYYYVLHSNSIMTKYNRDKIITGFRVFKKFSIEYEFKSTIKKYILPRWILGTLYTVSQIADFKEFLVISNEFDARNELMKLISFKDIKVIISSLLLIVSPRLFYFISRKYMKT